MNIKKYKAISSLIGFIAMVLMILGGVTGQLWLIYTTIGLVFGCAIITVIIMIARMSKTANKLDKNEKLKDEALLEAEDKQNVNSTCGVENKVANGERMIRHSAKAYKHSSLKEKILGFLFLFGFLGCIVGALVCSMIGNGTLALVFWGLAMGMGVISAITIAIKQKISISRAKKYVKNLENGSPTDLDQTTGVVKACIHSSESSVGTNHRTRITKTVYKVKLDVNGSEKIAYTERFLNEGEVVKVAFKHGSKLVAILENTKTSQLDSKIENNAEIETENKTEYQNEIEELYKEMEDLEEYDKIEDFKFDDSDDDFDIDDDDKK